MNILILEDAMYRIRDFRSHFPSARIVEQADECIDLLRNEDWDMVFLDHDLNSETYVDSNRPDTGMEVVRWIKINKPKVKKIIVHSLNYEAAREMASNLLASGYDVQAIPFLDLDWQELSK